jgi:glycosyltransferase involved in cell wall biosynthesis
MKTIIHLLNTDRYSGAENVAIQIIKFNSNKNLNFYYVSREGQIVNNLTSNAIKFKFFKSYLSLLSILKKLNPDIIHVHDFTLLIIVSFFKFFGLVNNVSLISHLHHNPKWIKKLNLKILVSNLALFNVNSVLCVSNAIKEEILLLPSIKKKLKVIGNPIFKRESLYNNKIFNEGQVKYDLLFVGRLVQQKQPIIFVDIVKILKKDFPKIKACIIGEGYLHNLLITKITNDNLSSNISLLGFMSNVEDFYLNSRILVVPSIFEGFGLVVVEAMSYGLPIIANSVGGLKDLVNNSFGQLIFNNNVEQYINEIKKLLIEKSYYDLKSKNSYNSYLSLLKLNKIYYNNLYKLYEE